MNSDNLYPLIFKPILKDKLWGGSKLGSVLQKPLDGRSDIGESWEISGVEGNISMAENGPLSGKGLVELIDTYKGDLIGHAVYRKFGSKFPLLIKFIDANDDLSIQVHPDDELAQRRHNSFGKTEMWYVVHAEDGATLISGFNQPVSKEKYLHAFEEGRLTEILNKENVYNDDVFFLPAGRVHTIGKGLLIAEIQQTSDITYRIYDFDRTDANGNTRELHVDEAIDAIDYTWHDEYKTLYDKSSDEALIGDSSYFRTIRLRISNSVERSYSGIDSCVILMVLEGSGTLSWGDAQNMEIQPGQSLLIPNVIGSVSLKATDTLKILEVTIP